LSIDNSTVDDLLLRSNRAVSVEPNLIAGGNDLKMSNGHYRHYLCQQKSLPNESTSQYGSSATMNRQFASSETLDQSISTSSQNLIMNPKNGYGQTVYKSNNVL
jgi:hypothetical protein